MNYEQSEPARFRRMNEKFREYAPVTQKKQTAASLQLCIRAEAAACFGNLAATKTGVLYIKSPLGFAACCTCGDIHEYKGQRKLLNGGHFIAGKRDAIRFDERNIHPQCVACNKRGGMPEAYARFMLSMYGQETIDELELMNEVQRTWGREELVEMRLGYMDRVKIAEAIIKDNRS